MTPPTKWQARRARRDQRRAIAAERDAPFDARVLAGVILGLCEDEGVRAGDTVTLYESFEGEPPTGDAITALVARGIRVIVPLTEPDFDLDWCDVADPHRTPLGREAIGMAALVLTPGLAVDREGTRMGQGGGCYDRALPRRRPGARAIVLLHPGELLPSGQSLPRDAHDVRVEGVVTVAGVEWLR